VENYKFGEIYASKEGEGGSRVGKVEPHFFMFNINCQGIEN